MNNELYSYCYSQYLEGKSNWKETWKKYGETKVAPHPEALRKRFQRERISRGHPTADEVAAGAEVPSNLDRETDDGRDPFDENIKFSPEDNDDTVKTTYREQDDSIYIVAASKRLKTPSDIIEYFELDMTQWKLDDFQISTSEGYRKDRKVSWRVNNGLVEHGDVQDSGKILVAPLVSVKAYFKRKVASDFLVPGNIEKLYQSLLSQESNHVVSESNSVPESNQTLVVPIADLHLGLLSTMEENREEYNLKVAQTRVRQYLAEVLNRVKGKKFAKVILIVGNDFLNTDNLNNSTTAGTGQDSETFWFSIMNTGQNVLVEAVDTLLTVGDVEVWNAVSNHDLHSTYSLMRILAGWYRNDDRVTVDLMSHERKYAPIGDVVLCLAHEMKISDAEAHVMSEAQRELPLANRYIWLLAHRHQAMIYEEKGKVEIYRLPTFSGTSRWGTRYVRSAKRGFAFVVKHNSGISDMMIVDFS